MKRKVTIFFVKNKFNAKKILDFILTLLIIFRACPCFAGSPPYGFRFAHGFATASRPSRRLTQKLSYRGQTITFVEK
jgi:hypothetical protein